MQGFARTCPCGSFDFVLRTPLRMTVLERAMGCVPGMIARVLHAFAGKGVDLVWFGGGGVDGHDFGSGFGNLQAGGAF